MKYYNLPGSFFPESSQAPEKPLYPTRNSNTSPCWMSGINCLVYVGSWGICLMFGNVQHGNMMINQWIWGSKTHTNSPSMYHGVPSKNHFTVLCLTIKHPHSMVPNICDFIPYTSSMIILEGVSVPNGEITMIFFGQRLHTVFMYHYIYPYAPCMAYLPTFALKITQM